MNELKPFDDALAGLIASLTPKARKALAVTVAKRLRASQQQRIKRPTAPRMPPVNLNRCVNPRAGLSGKCSPSCAPRAI